jgi:putative membrane protein
MFELSGTAFLWIKALHVISVISWMAGMLYLPRLFVYHCEAQIGSDKSETLKVMERRLLRAIMTPAMLASWLFGGILLYNIREELLQPSWLHAKLACVVAMTAAHMMMARWRREFAEDRNSRSHKFYRTANEVPTLLMIVIVVMVVVKPF